MLDILKSRKEAEKRKYGNNMGRVPYDPKQCAYEVAVDEGRWTSFHQCRFKPGHGPDGIFCKRHTPEAFKKRDAKRDEKYKKKMQVERPKWYAHEMLCLLKESQSQISKSWIKRRDKLIEEIESED